MRWLKHPQSVWISTRFEIFEERLFFTADPIADFYIDEQVIRSTTQYAQDLIPAWADVHQMTGVSYVHDVFGFDGSGQTVVVVDSGVAYDHYALGGGLGKEYRVVGGKDFTEENDADPYDDGPAGFHGTHVAGIIGSSDTTHRGVAPGVDLIALRVFNDQGEGYFSWVENALNWVHEHKNSFANPITTVNLSLGTAWNSDRIPLWSMLEDEFARIHADGIFVSVAAGNDFQDYGVEGLSYPAVSPYVVPVSSVTNGGWFSSFSQRHDRVIAAPGQSITSTVPDYLFDLNGVVDDFATASGTSMATPYVAGASMLVREAMDFAGYSNITQDTIYDHIRDTAYLFYDPFTDATYHRLDLKSALRTIMPSDDYGSSSMTAFSLGDLTDDSSFTGTIGQLDDVDYFTFIANQTGTVSLSAVVTHQLEIKWQLLGESVSIEGSEMTFDAIGDKAYTFSIATAKGVGHYNISTGFDVASKSVNLVDLARQIDRQLGLDSSGRYYENWGGWNEKWFHSTDGDWYFITPEGELYQWNGQSDLNQSHLYAILDANYYQEPTLLHDAYIPEKSLFALAYQIDQELDLDFTGKYYHNWGGWDEKWMLSNRSDWYFITPDGGLYRWMGGTDLRQSTHVLNLDSTFYSDPSLLHDASPIGIDVTLLANELDQKLNLSFTGNFYENWGGWNEKWLLSNGSQWYFITPQGNFYRWQGGSDLSQSTWVASLDDSYFNNPSMLYNASRLSGAQNRLTSLGGESKDDFVSDMVPLHLVERDVRGSVCMADNVSYVRFEEEFELDQIDRLMAGGADMGRWLEQVIFPSSEFGVENGALLVNEVKREFSRFKENWNPVATLKQNLGVW